MSTRKKVITLIIVFFMFGLTLLGILNTFRDDSVRLASGKVKYVSFDLGEIFFGQIAREDFVIHNISSETLLLEGKTECGCTKMTINDGYIEPDSEMKVSLAYHSALKKSTGHIKNRFVINNEVLSSPGKNIKQTILDGTLNVFVRPTIIFSPSDIEVLIPKGQEVRLCDSIQVENIGNYPIELNFDKNISSDIGLTVSPEKFTIEPHEKYDVKITSSIPIKYSDMVRVSDIAFTGSLYNDKKDFIALQYNFPVKISPSRLVVVTPGALFFAGSEIHKTKTFCVKGLGGGHLKIESVQKPDSIIIKNVEDDTFSVKLDPDKIPTGTFNEEITLIGAVNDRKFVATIPVMGLKKKP